jgi:hypothetical protein
MPSLVISSIILSTSNGIQSEVKTIIDIDGFGILGDGVFLGFTISNR